MLRPRGDTEGIISASKIDLHSLPTDILEVFSPLLCEMEELGTTLNLEEFLDASLRLYATLNIQERNMILNFKKSKKRGAAEGELGKCTFYPQLNPRSLKMVSEKSHSHARGEGEVSGELAEKLIRHHKQQQSQQYPTQFGGTFSPFSNNTSGLNNSQQHLHAA
jgi:hypothetical protein